MKKIKSFIQSENPDILCLQELSFPASLYIPNGYKRIGISISHHIYVKKNISDHSLGWHIFYNSACIDDIIVTNVHGTWKKYMNNVFNNLRHYRVNGSIIVGDFNKEESEVEENLGITVRDQLGIELKDTFSHYSKEQSYTPDHALMFGIKPKAYNVINDNYEMSDHLPIIIEW